MMRNTIILLEGPDGCGKTEISRALSLELGIPYFKVDSEKANWANDAFKHSMWFDFTLPQFLKTTRVSYIGDRSYVSEWVYSKVFGRQTNDKMLAATDEAMANLGTIVVIALRRNYAEARSDELIPNDKLQPLHDKYLEFAQWTKCRVAKIYVDDFDNDLGKELDNLVPALVHLSYFGPRKTVIDVQSFDQHHTKG